MDFTPADKGEVGHRYIMYLDSVHRYIRVVHLCRFSMQLRYEGGYMCGYESDCVCRLRSIHIKIYAFRPKCYF